MSLSPSNHVLTPEEIAEIAEGALAGERWYRGFEYDFDADVDLADIRSGKPGTFYRAVYRRRGEIEFDTRGYAIPRGWVISPVRDDTKEAALNGAKLIIDYHYKVKEWEAFYKRKYDAIKDGNIKDWTPPNGNG